MPKRFCGSLVISCVLLTTGNAIHGQAYLFDDFRDNNVRDGAPIGWEKPWGGTLGAANGRLEISGHSVHVAATRPIESQTSWSIQARASLDAPGQIIGLGILFDQGSNVWLGMFPDGTLSLGTPGVTLASAGTGVFHDDVMLRLDALDNTLQGWAWELESEMPEEPFVVYETEVRRGRSGVWMETASGEPTARFNFFEAATEPLQPFVYGDFNFDRSLDALDIDVLSMAIKESQFDTELDLTNDEILDNRDHEFWVTWVKQTWFGDTNLDGRFDNFDLVQVLQADEYMDEVVGNSTWATGDWNGDGDFDALDLVVALQDGGYEHGPRFASLRAPSTPTAAAQVPESSAVGLLIDGVLSLSSLRACTITDPSCLATQGKTE